MKTYECQECGGNFSEEELEPENFADGEYLCFTCVEFLSEVADEFMNG